MAAPRSPRYPNITLGEALARAKAIYSKEHMSTMTPSVAAEAMGYNGINGSSLKTISSLKKYGLLEGRGEDLRLSKDAQTLIIDEMSSPDYRAAIARAAMGPEIYAEIRKQFPGFASERNISVYLEKQGFMPDAAVSVAKNYKDTMALVPEGATPYAGGQEEEAGDAPLTPTHAETPHVIRPTGTALGLSTSAPMAAVAPTPGLPRVVQDGKMLTISAVVDLKGLRRLKLMLDNYEKLLEMFEDQVEIAKPDS